MIEVLADPLAIIPGVTRNNASGPVAVGVLIVGIVFGVVVLVRGRRLSRRNRDRP